MPFRIERVMRKQNLSEGEARKTIEKVDKMRENYVKKYTGTSRYASKSLQPLKRLLTVLQTSSLHMQMQVLILRRIGFFPHAVMTSRTHNIIRFGVMKS